MPWQERLAVAALSVCSLTLIGYFYSSIATIQIHLP